MKVARQFIAWNRAQPQTRPGGYDMIRVQLDVHTQDEARS